MTETGTCTNCGNEIPSKSRICPNCRYMGEGIYGAGVVLFCLGAVLSIFIVTAVIGIPMMLIALPMILWGMRTQVRPTEVT